LTTEWIEVDFGQVATLQRGYDLPYRVRKRGTVPVVTSTGVTDTHSEAKEQAPGVVTGRYGTIGEVFFIEEDYWPHNTTLFVKDFHGNDPLFVSYILRTIDFQSHSGKSGVPGVNRNDLHALRVRIPPTEAEQRAITAVLSDVDALLAGLGRLIAKKRDLKQAAMQELLNGRVRLPGFNGRWEVTSLTAICVMKSGEGITSADIDDYSTYPCYGGNGLRGYTSRFTHDGCFALIGRQGALCGNVIGVEGKFFASEHAVVVTPYSETDIRWLTYVLATMNLNQYSESSAQPGLSVSKVLMLDVYVPPSKAEQTAIATVLADMDAEIAALEQRRRKTQDLKQALMQELLTGRTRLIPRGEAEGAEEKR
jgi:type I restriction enzyme S subunit